MSRIINGCFVATVAFLAAGLVLAGDQKDPKAILDKAIMATGGEENLAKQKPLTWKGKGTYHGAGEPLEFTGDWFIKPPSKQKTQFEFDFNGTKASRIQVLNGDKGWISMGGSVDEMTEEQVVEFKEGLYALRVASLAPLTGKEFTLAPLGEEKIGDRAAVGIKVSSKGHRDIGLYFDKETGMLAKTQMRVKDILSDQEMDQESLPSDYKDAGGVKRAHKMVINRDGKKWIELEISEFKTVDTLDESLFGKPGL